MEVNSVMRTQGGRQRRGEGALGRRLAGQRRGCRRKPVSPENFVVPLDPGDKAGQGGRDTEKCETWSLPS